MASRNKPLYKLNAEEKKIFELAQSEDPNYFCDYYFRSANSGTWWLPGQKSERWKGGYERIYQAWLALNNPEAETFEALGHKYRVIWNHELSRQYPDLPAFHHNHGWLLLPWAKQLHLDRHPFITVIGGKGSSKTMGAAQGMLVSAATLPGYRGFVLAPVSYQINEVYKVMGTLMEGTRYWDRFRIDGVMSPNPMLKIGNDVVGENTIEFYSIKENPEKILTLTGDEAIVDQSEQLNSFADVMDVVGTRFRGREPRSGRSRIGRLIFMANSADNQEMWDLHDRAELDQYKDDFAAYTLSSYDNPYLTDKDIHNFELSVGGDAESIRIGMKGGRPLGNGAEFSREVVERNKSVELTELMLDGINQGLDGYIRLHTPQAGFYEWLLPPREGRIYMQMSDPGTANPPYRNSPPIMIFDITDFPKLPADLVGFVWVFGKGDIRNWATRFAELAHRYNTLGRCAFDATGPQAGYDQWMYILDELLVEKMSLTGNNKPLYLNSAKMLFSKGLFRIPSELDHIFSQLTRYDILEDKTSSKMRQDLVMTIIMAAFWLMRLYWSSFNDDPFNPRPDYDADDRLFRTGKDRYEGHVR